MQIGVRKENSVEPGYLSEKSGSNCSSQQLFPHLHLQRPPDPFTLSPEQERKMFLYRKVDELIRKTQFEGRNTEQRRRAFRF